MRNHASRNLLFIVLVALSMCESVDAQTSNSIIQNFDPKSQVVSGDWQKRGGALVVGSENASRAVLATKALEDYSLSIDFTREEGDNSIGVILPIGEAQCAFIMSAFNGEAHGIGVVDGRLAKENSTTIRPGKLETGHPYRLLIEVDVNGDTASINSTLDGRPFLKWSGKQGSLTMFDAWNLSSSSCVGLCTFAKTTFHSVTLTKLDPAMRMTDVQSQPQAVSSDTPKTTTFEERKWVAPQAESITVDQYKGKTALHIKGKEPNFVFLPDTRFGDGTIEVDIASSTFSGIGFCGNEDGSIVEKLYFRPFNSGTEKHANSVQHSMLGKPALGWRALREKAPGRHESGADIKADQWFHVRVKIEDGRLTAFVNQDNEPVLSGNLLGERKSGRIGVWGWDSYFANFHFTPAD